MNIKKILIIVCVVIAIGIVIFLVTRKEKKVEYYLTTMQHSMDNTLFEDYKSFLKFRDKAKGIKETLENKVTFKKTTIDETFTEEFFKDKKLAVVVVYEDNSKDYMYSIDKVEYNSDKTEATITYTYKFGTFADTLAQTWYDCMFVELENTVTDVKFVRDNSTKK